MRTRFACAVCALLLCSAIWAQKNSEYRTGRLAEIRNTTDLLDNSQKASYLLKIQDGAEQLFAYYKIHALGHDDHKQLVAGADIPYRVSGDSVFVKTPDGKEIKTRLCKRVGYFAKCGNVSFADPDSP